MKSIITIFLGLLFSGVLLANDFETFNSAEDTIAPLANRYYVYCSGRCQNGASVSGQGVAHNPPWNSATDEAYRQMQVQCGGQLNPNTVSCNWREF